MRIVTIFASTAAMLLAGYQTPQQDAAQDGAQEPPRKQRVKRGGERPQRGEQSVGRTTETHPLMTALDLDKDGALSEREIQAASRSLQTLDQNKDGRISRSELRPPVDSARAERIVVQLMRFDENKDGVISLSELPDRMQRGFKLADRDKSGGLDESEVRRFAETMSQRRGGPGTQPDPSGFNDGNGAGPGAGTGGGKKRKKRTEPTDP